MSLAAQKFIGASKNDKTARAKDAPARRGFI
jgi:hypothetical protein